MQSVSVISIIWWAQHLNHTNKSLCWWEDHLWEWRICLNYLHKTIGSPGGVPNHLCLCVSTFHDCLHVRSSSFGTLCSDLLHELPAAKNRTPKIWLKKVPLVYFLLKILVASRKAGMERKQQQMKRTEKLLIWWLSMMVWMFSTRNLAFILLSLVVHSRRAWHGLHVQTVIIVLSYWAGTIYIVRLWMQSTPYRTKRTRIVLYWLEL